MAKMISVKEAARLWNQTERRITGLCRDGFMLGICALFGNSYVTSSRESGDGRYDIQLAPKTNTLPSIIIELKAEKDYTEKELKAFAATALKQINDKNTTPK